MFHVIFACLIGINVAYFIYQPIGSWGANWMNPLAAGFIAGIWVVCIMNRRR